ncbi:hypothetical protein [Acrocarpospora catenulata]|uniref:hypothetical protein n=1 Tax=Acrocarpospora catenulata TaxID=2836182 RepID=UPI001BDB5C43|nr:hypothetical protein [Acrocarpospora catenulata]
MSDGQYHTSGGPREVGAGCSPAVTAVASALLSISAVFATGLGYLFGVYDYEWDPEVPDQVDPDAVAFVTFLSMIGLFSAIGALLLLRKHMAALICYSILILLAGYRAFSVASLLPG